MRRKILIMTLAAFVLSTLLASCHHRAHAAEEGRPRVISLYAAHTEVLLRLGAKDNIIGVSGQETYTGPETENWEPPVFSIRDDVEKFLAAKPDLVLVRPMHMAAGSRLVATLESAGVKVYSAQVVRAGDLYKYWRGLGALVGRDDEAEKMIADFDSKIAAYHEAASAKKDKPGVFIEAIHDQVKTFTPDSLPVWLVELGGGRNVADDARPSSPGLIIANYGPERLLAKADQVDIFVSQIGVMNPHTLDKVKERNIYQPLKAFREGHVYKIPENIFARPTPSLLDGLEMIAGWTGLEIKDTPPVEAVE
ncbi:peptide ABC transporter substrate-binding protein [Deltaproteobacteria bacterium Smac51]|nr:peptide ABC transporter substrate-binding protein [Deltaproteobacteria bacterium Smac51]